MDRMLAGWQRSLIYVPQRVPEVRPEEFGWPKSRCQPVRIAASDQVQLNGWLILADGHAAHGDVEFDRQLHAGRTVILYFCGNGRHRGYRQASVRTLTGLGCDVLICDYRGYGDNGGSPTEKHLIADAQALWRYATETRGVDARRIVIYGESLGGGVATALASELCRAGTEPGGMIVQSTFPSLVAAGKFHYPWLPVRWVLVDRFPSVERIRRVTCPILQIHGRLDGVIPWSMGEELYAAIPARSSAGIAKSLIELPQTDHNDVYDENSPDRDVLIAGLQSFLQAIRSDRPDSALA
jgi:fermentation-respiration switch protein FrsA (DUF1100 family)